MFSSQWLFLTVPFALLFLLFRKEDPRRRRLPPGPPPVPLLGNIGIDIGHPWKTYAKWSKQYGNIVYARLLGQDIIVVNSEEVAQDLLERRSHNYSSRPASLYAVNEFLGAEFFSIFLPYGDRWRLHRKFFHQAFHPTATPLFRPIQLRKVHDLIVHLMLKPDQFQAHLQLLSASLIMSVVYGYDISGPDDNIAIQLERALEIVVNALRPEVAAILTAFPFIKYLPAWFPGARFKRQALISRSCIPTLVNYPFEHVRKNMAEGTAAPSMVLDGILRLQDRATTEAESVYLEKEMKEACASAYGAASDTTYSTLLIFCLVMILYPDVQARAQAEIDSVIGEGLLRLPQWEDRSSLPYLEAVLKETLRWHPVAPIIAHATVDDDFYEGYYIPKGAAVIVNAWAVSHDPTKYPEPQKFKPERFLHGNSQSVDELSFAFGFGRRICAGRHVADASLWISMVTLLAVFRFEALPWWDPGPDGAKLKWTEGLTTRPESFPCEIKPRHENLSRERLAHLMRLAAS